MHTDDMNDLVLMGLARDAAEAEAAQLRARVQELEAALVKCVNRSDLPRDVEKIAFAALQKQEGE